jgi:hypothetical protein
MTTNHTADSILDSISKMSVAELNFALDSVEGQDYISNAIRELLRVAIVEKSQTDEQE